MGTLFPDSPEYPTFRPTPRVLLEASRLGLLPLMIVVLIAQHQSPMAAFHAEKRTPISAWVAALSMDVDWEDPHTHNETGDHTPRATRAERVSTSSSTSVPFVPS